MFNKIINISLSPDDVTVLDNEILKTAGESDFLNGHDFDPDFVYLLVRGVSAGEYWGSNNNDDFFEEEELKQNHNTFLDAKVFKNHDNKDVAKGIGDVLKTEWDDDMKAVMLTLRIDKSLGPTIARGFLKGTITDVSMGCRVDHIICSYCGQRAKTRKDYCEHLTDKSIRGKIMPNGIKVFEINKTPKFHDISVVIKGADRTAKAFKVVDGKTAEKNNDLKKVASMGSRISKVTKSYVPEYKLTAEDIGLSKTASDKDMLKVAEIDKLLRGSLVAISTAENLKETEDKFSDIVDILKLFYTEYFEEEDINNIVAKIKELSEKRKKPEKQIFKTFLRTAELAGIELSPLEFAKINSKLDCSDFPYEEATSKIMDVIPKEDVKPIVMGFRGDNIERDPSVGMFGRFGHSPFEDPDIPLEIEIFKSLLGNDIMEERSFNPRHLVNKITLVIKGNRKPSSSFLKHFILPAMSMTKVASEKIKEDMISYASYQDARVKLLNSGELEKYSSVITGEREGIIKEALSKAQRIKRTIMMYPLSMGYSKYQKSKMDSGRRVSPFNKFMADNPMTAFVAGTVGYHKGKDLLKAIGKLSSKAAKGTGSAIKNTFKNTGKVLKKTASIDDIIVNNDFLNISILGNEELNNRMIEKYSKDEVDIIKMSIYNYFNDREDLYENGLKEAGLSEDDCDYFLKEASELVMSEIEKIAGISDQPPSKKGFGENFKEVGKDVLLDTAFYGKNMGGGALSVLPGSIIDGIIFNRITNKLTDSMDGLEKKEEGNINESL